MYYYVTFIMYESSYCYYKCESENKAHAVKALFNQYGRTENNIRRVKIRTSPYTQTDGFYDADFDESSFMDFSHFLVNLLQNSE